MPDDTTLPRAFQLNVMNLAGLIQPITSGQQSTKLVDPLFVKHEE